MPLATEQSEITFAGALLILDSAGAVYVPYDKCLIVSDLHLEKASFLKQFGSPLPAYDTRHTLDRLAPLIDKYQPQQVVCLGDSFHDAKAFARLHPDDQVELLRLVGSVPQWHWVLGNHDPHLSDAVPGLRHTEILLQNIWLRHEPEAQEQPQIVGHFHPKITLRLGGQRVSGKAFIYDDKLMIMPAFGSYTGGLDTQYTCIASLLTAPQQHLLYRNRIWKIDKTLQDS